MKKNKKIFLCYFIILIAFYVFLNSCGGKISYKSLSYDIDENETGDDLFFGASSIVDLQVGEDISCALIGNGKVKCWGDYRWLGYDAAESIGDDELPSDGDFVNIPEEENALFLAVGSYHGCVITDLNNVYCWGNAWGGLLGQGNTTSVRNPVLVDLGSIVPVELSAGRNHNCVRTTHGKVKCWGYNNVGQLGLGHTNNLGDDELVNDLPDVVLSGAAIQIESGTGDNTCALIEDGSVQCWGPNNYGQMGLGDTSGINANIGDDENPITIGNIPLNIEKIGAGGWHTICALKANKIYCWGNGTNGILGNASTASFGDNETLLGILPIDVGADIIDFDIGEAHVCVILKDSLDVTCWGYGFHGILGRGDGDTTHVGDNELPSSKAPIGFNSVVHIATGRFHSCVLTLENEVHCWGRSLGDNGEHGMLGYGNTSNVGDNETPLDAGTVSIF